LLSRAWGNRGELSGVPLSNRPERFQRLGEVYLFASGTVGEPTPVEVESVWPHGGRLIFKFRGVDTISEAERLEGAEVRIPADQREPLGPGEYYHSDLLGCELVDRASGKRLGVVTGWQEFGGAPLIEVETPGRAEPLLVPFARPICVEIDVAGRRIAVELPEGFAELDVPRARGRKRKQ
jgi:16S rRNA processing protein RimM